MRKAEPSTRQLRRQFLERHVDLENARILEIGAMDAPTFPDGDRDVRYLDWFSREELIERHGANERRRPEAMVEVDYVVKSPDFSTELGGRFDLVIANHVIEHVPDPIRWLQQAEAATAAEGHLFLAVPDRRYTFDYLRPESTFPDLLRAHEQRLERADYYQVLSSLLYHRPVRAEDAWSGRLEEKLGQPRFSVPDAMRRARSLSEEYAGIHCHVFTRESFERVLGETADSGLIGWRIAAMDDVKPGRNEFHVLFRPGSASA